ncbi:MAG: HAMP domain-containing sensor histidine kinase [Anaerorhabdus sp.]
MNNTCTNLLIFISLFLTMIFIIQTLRIHFINRELNQIKYSLKLSINNDTNSLLTTSSSNKFILQYVIEINELLKSLLKQRNKYINNNRDLRHKISNISHDIRTPLTAITGYINLLKNEETSDNAKRYIKIIDNRFDYLQQLTEEFFEYSLLEDQVIDKTQKIIINDLLEESIIGFYASFKNYNLTPVISLTETKVIRQLNSTSVIRLFTNILSNMLKYAEGGIEIILNDNGDIYFINETTKLNFVDVDHLFNRYYTINNSKKSSGLGLEISKHLVSQMNGSLDARIKEGKLIIHIHL